MIAIGLVFYIFSAFGLAYIVGHSVISEKIRIVIYGDKTDIAPIRFAREGIVDLVECPACFGFWTGIFAALFGTVPFEVRHLDVIAWGLFTSGSNYVIAKITKLI